VDNMNGNIINQPYLDLHFKHYNPIIISMSEIEIDPEQYQMMQEAVDVTGGIGALSTRQVTDAEEKAAKSLQNEVEQALTAKAGQSETDEPKLFILLGGYGRLFKYIVDERKISDSIKLSDRARNDLGDFKEKSFRKKQQLSNHSNQS
jgi:hypothetical protein